MAPADYETEYNARGAVPDHPAIFARRDRDSEAYRAQASAEGRAELGVSYGPSKRQIVDLFMPKAAAGAPVAVFIHGGYWRTGEPALYSNVARGPNAHGVTVALAGYDLCPQVSIAEITGQIRAACLYLWKRFNRRLLVTGHSAGGHLTAAMFATDWAAHSAPADLVPAAMPISGLFDLEPLRQTSMNQDFRMDEAAARASSPLLWPAPPAGRTIDVLVGGAETGEFRRQSRVLADAWSRAGVNACYREIPGANHFTVIEPLADPQSAMVERFAELARMTARP